MHESQQSSQAIYQTRVCRTVAAQMQACRDARRVAMKLMTL
jgi:hypothetical protein